MTSLFQMLRYVIAGGGRRSDGECTEWKMEGWGISVPDLIVKFTEVSLIKFSPMKAVILNLSPTQRNQPIDFHFHYQKIIDLKDQTYFSKNKVLLFKKNHVA